MVETYRITEVCPLCHTPTSEAQVKTEFDLLDEVHCDLRTSPLCEKCKAGLAKEGDFCTCNAPDFMTKEEEVQEGGRIVTKVLGEYCHVCSKDRAPKEVSDEN